MNHRQLLTRLLPPVSYAPDGRRLQGELGSEGTALDMALVSADKASGGITPLYAEQQLIDWERVCGIKGLSETSYQYRLQAVLAKLAETGGLSIPYFIRLAKSIGYDISIMEPQPFRADVNCADDQLWDDDTIWAWRVLVSGSAVKAYRFNAGQSAAGERLTVFSDQVIEEVMRDLKPAHTYVYFAYQED